MSRKIPTTIKDPELVAQRRRQIIDVATHLFLERGFHKTSIRDIARACPFNLASLYMYVTSKEDILFLVAQQLIDEKARAMAAVEILEDDPAESFRTALRSYCRIVHHYRPHIRLLYRELDVLSPPRREIVMASLSTVTDVFEQIIRRGIERCLRRSGTETRRTQRAVPLPSLVDACSRAALITNDINEFFEMQSRICCKVSLRASLSPSNERAVAPRNVASKFRPQQACPPCERTATCPLLGPVIC